MRYLFYAVLLSAILMTPQFALAQEQAALQAANPQDPFVRGLQRLDERLRMAREAESLARRALELEQRKRREAAGELFSADETGEAISAGLVSDPDFFTAFAARKYRLDGLVLSRPQSEPVIHIYKEKQKPDKNILYWSGEERRWVYERLVDEPLAAIAKKLVMQLDDLLAMNGVSRVAQLPNAKRFYVSPRDNGPLTHIITRGDTLAKLAKVYDTDAARLRVRNNLDASAALVVGRRFLVREKAINERLSNMAVPQPPKLDLSYLEQARLPYARLGQFKTKAEALRSAREFYNKYYELMDSDIVLRLERASHSKNRRFYNMDIGPLRSLRHGEAFCALFRRDNLPCLVVERVPGPERVRNFDSQAVISVSPYVYFDDENEINSAIVDVEKLTKLEYFLTEGQELGNNEGTIAKITPDRIMLTDASGYLLTLPLNKIPEIDPIAKLKAEEAARQRAIAQAAAVATGAGANVAKQVGEAAAEVDTGAVGRIKEKEIKRRARSVDALNQVLGTDIK